MDHLKGKVVLITGAGKGTGRALAEALAAHGAIVAANDISPINVEMVVDAINAAGGQARAYVHDVAKKVDVQVMINTLSDDFGRIDVLINCANVQPSASLLDLDEWDLHRVFEVNAIGSLLMMQSVGRVMRAQGGGLIVNVIKIPEQAPLSFVASRAGLAALTEYAESDLGRYNIRVVAVSGEEIVARVVKLLENG
jgi:meso-butanediol dehydrogenase / (S,S)-butanediol dehydrogenase / diacetyl reductase